MRDAFGMEIGAGDYVLSATTSTGRVRTGRAYINREGRFMLDTDRSFWYGTPERNFQRKAPFGAHVVVLRKADGIIPDHIAGESGG